MELTITVAYPAGNTTVLVETPVPERDYAEVAGSILAMGHLHAEQVGFLVPPRFGGDVRLEMMGGEFCGNALRSAGLWHICNAGLGGKRTVNVEISGETRVLPVTYEPATGSVTAEMPLPQSISTCDINGEHAVAVCFEGIVHVIANKPDDWMTLDEIRAALREVALHYKKNAAGLVLFDPIKNTLHPAVYVADTDTLTCENSCASGSAAVAAFAAVDKPDGEYELELCQPGGTLRTTTTVSGGALTKIMLSGIITLTDSILAKI